MNFLKSYRQLSLFLLSVKSIFAVPTPCRNPFFLAFSQEYSLKWQHCCFLLLLKDKTCFEFPKSHLCAWAFCHSHSLLPLLCFQKSILAFPSNFGLVLVETRKNFWPTRCSRTLCRSWLKTCLGIHSWLNEIKNPHWKWTNPKVLVAVCVLDERIWGSLRLKKFIC